MVLKKKGLMFEDINFKNPNFPIKHPAGTHPEYCMILLHGYGSDGNDLISLSHMFNQVMSNTVYLSPHAPHKTPFGGHQWFPLSNLSDRELETGTIAIAPYVHHFIDQALAYFKVKPENLILAGFSQGAMTVLHVGLERDVAPCGVLAYSGALTAATSLKDRIKSKPPVLLCHGSDDDVVLASYSEKADKVLKSHGIISECLIIKGYPHTIPPEAMTKSLDFLRSVSKK